MTAQTERPLYEGEGVSLRGMGSDQLLREVADREEIRDLIARYAHRVAHGVSIADLYTDDGAFITRFPGRPVREIRGREALDRHFDFPRSGDRPLPMIHNIMLEITGDTASGICSNELRMTEDARSMIGSGYYLDKYRRERGRWRFVVRDITFIHWVPIYPGWTGAPEPPT
jgi:hypothetical protein